MVSNKYIIDNLPVLQVLGSCNSNLAKQILRHVSSGVGKALINLLDLAFGTDPNFALKPSIQYRLRKRFGSCSEA